MELSKLCLPDTHLRQIEMMLSTITQTEEVKREIEEINKKQERLYRESGCIQEDGEWVRRLDPGN